MFSMAHDDLFRDGRAYADVADGSIIVGDPPFRRRERRHGQDPVSAHGRGTQVLCGVGRGEDS